MVLLWEIVQLVFWSGRVRRDLPRLFGRDRWATGVWLGILIKRKLT